MQHYKHDSNYFNNIKTVNFILYYMHSAAARKIHICSLSYTVLYLS